MSAYKTISPLVLASSSSVRERMLRDLGIAFTVIQPTFDEEGAKASIESLSPSERASFLAKGKADSVSRIHASWLVIGADQVCECDGQILDKPMTEEKAFDQLKFLSGKTHHQHSAIALYQNNECLWDIVETASLTMRNLTDDEIYAYIQLDKPLTSCGTYHFEEHGKHLFSHIEGRDDVVMGLPVLPMLNELHTRSLFRQAAA